MFSKVQYKTAAAVCNMVEYVSKKRTELDRAQATAANSDAAGGHPGESGDAVGGGGQEAGSDALKVGCVLDVLMADETKQRLLMQLGGQLLLQQTAQAPHVLISLRTCVFSLLSEHLEERWYELPWVTAPVACISTTAGTLQYVFEEMKGVCTNKTFNMLISKLGASAKDVVHVRCLDGAGSGWRWYTKEVLDLARVSNHYSLPMHCCLHVLNLTVTLSVTQWMVCENSEIVIQ